MGLLNIVSDRSLNNIVLLLQTSFLAVLFWQICIVLHNLFFHPLKKYSGPWYFAISQIPGLYHLQKGDTHKLMVELHEKYGPVVRVGPNQLSFTGSNAWKDIYGYRGANGETFQKDPVMLGKDLKKSEEGINRADDSSHSRQRRILSHAFSNKALMEQEPLIRGYVNTLIQCLHEHAVKNMHEPLDIVRLYNFTTFDIMADLTFGESLGMLENGAYVPWVTSMLSYQKAITLTIIFRTYPILNYIASWLQPKSVLEKRKRHIQYSIDLVNRRLKQEVNRGDIWSLVMRHTNINQMTKWEMYSNARTFMAAGSDTMAALLSAATYFLLKNPAKMEFLVKEIRAVQNPLDLNITKLQSLQYLNACLEEALRLYPPGPNARNRITPRGGATICGGFVPEKTVVGIPFFASLRSGVNFADPVSFVPERWLATAPSRYKDDDRAAMQPFSVGPRNCIGQNLAWHEMRLIFSSVLWHFDFHLATPDFDWTDQETYIAWEKHPLPVFLSLAVTKPGN